MAEHNANLWAPWRAEYIRGLSESSASDCFLCDYAGDPQHDRQNHVLWRTPDCLVVMNRFPYTNGHLLIAPLAHVASLSEVGAAALAQMTQAACHAEAILGEVVHAQGFNIGINLGRCAGAGLPGHVHAHVVPRWSGDTNFMTTVAGTRLIPEDMDDLTARLRSAAATHGVAVEG
jgi:ATP adenylyltransferase